jgi:hypothetical protein
MIYVTNYQIELRNEAAANRLAKKAKSQSPRNSSRFAAALTSLRSILATSAEGPALPKLTDYPYRS